MKDENFIEQRENDFNSMILYRIYDKKFIDFKVSYHKEDHFTLLDESKTINNTHVEYENSTNHTFKASFTSNKGTYETQFNLNEVSKEEAFEIIDTIINNINN